MRIIGITGTLGSGKGAIVNFLKREMAYTHYSVRDYLINEINKRGLEVNRDIMTQTANELRRKHGSSYIIEKLYEEAAKSDNNCIIESIRTTGEIEALRKKGDFILLAVDAPLELRYERIKKRNSETDNISFEQFKQNENREMICGDINCQNLKKCMAMADYIFYNDGSISQLEESIKQVIMEMNSLK